MNAAPVRQTHWDGRATTNFVAGGAGGALAVFVALAAREDVAWLVHGGLPAIALVAVGLAAVGAELGRPLRALGVFRAVRCSWMSREAVAASVLVAAGGVAAALGDPSLSLLAGFAGLALVYCQARMLAAAKGIPAWRDPAIVPLVVLGDLAEGGAVFLVLASARGSPPWWAGPLVAALVAARLAAWAAYRDRVTRPGSAPSEAGDAIRAIDRVFLAAGHVAPLGLLVAGGFLERAERSSFLVAALLVIATGAVAKRTLLGPAAATQGPSLPRAPARTPGHAGAGARPGWVEEPGPPRLARTGAR